MKTVKGRIAKPASQGKKRACRRALFREAEKRRGRIVLKKERQAAAGS